MRMQQVVTDRADKTYDFPVERVVFGQTMHLRTNQHNLSNSFSQSLYGEFENIFENFVYKGVEHY